MKRVLSLLIANHRPNSLGASTLSSHAANRLVRWMVVPVVLALLVLSSESVALSVQIGDNDGFGFGAAVCPDPVTLCPFSTSGEGPDNRSLSELAATNGAQYTDVHAGLGFSSLLPGVLTFVFALPVDVVSATLTVDMGGFQASSFGPLDVRFNGVLQPGLFAVNDGTTIAWLRTFPLSASTIASANAVNQLTVTVTENEVFSTGFDFVAFDYLRLDATEVPEPATATLVMLGVTAVAVRRRPGFAR